MNAQDLSTLDSDTPTLRGYSYLEQVLSNDVASAEIMAYWDVLTLGRIRRASKTCAHAVTRIGYTRLRYYACVEWMALNYNDFCQPGTDIPGGAHMDRPADVLLAIDNLRTWMQAWTKTWSCPQTKYMAEYLLDFDRQRDLRQPRSNSTSSW
jgi:hypothetical protein